MEKIDFDGVDLAEVINRIPANSRAILPFGLVKLSTDGTILEYNMAESEITGIRPEAVVGKNFFLDVAVCTQRPEFYGKFREGIAKGVLNQMFDYVFDYNMEPTRVRVHMFSSHDHAGAKFVWLMVKRMGTAPAATAVAKQPVVAAPVAYEPAPHLPPAFAPTAAPESLSTRDHAQASAPAATRTAPPPAPVPPPPRVDDTFGSVYVDMD